ncbi:MAG: putative LPS assembly protein LptD [Ferruginibacter sp.]
MDHHYKGKRKNILAWLSALLLIIITLYTNASAVKVFYFHISLTRDTIPPKKKPGKIRARTNEKPVANQPSISPAKDLTDTTIKPVTDTIHFKASKDSLDGPVSYHADDSMIFDVPGKKLLLYGKVSSVKYLDNELAAPFIEYDQSTNLVKAFLKTDSLGNVIAYPTFNQGDFKTKSDSIIFNMKSGRGLTKGTYTQQGEMYVYGEKIKKVDKDIFYASRARFTTCNLDTPHFAFVSNKIKFINKKMGYSGPVHPEFEGVPIPVYLPFGIYPLNQGRHSGILAPSFTANDQMGLALEGLGYYKILSQTWDVIFRGTIYSYGGWTASLNPRYFKKYRYQGNLSIDLQNFKTNFKGDPDYSSSRTMNIRWSHTADTKARPGVNFSANVNAGSSKFNAQVPNSPVRNFTNQMNSSITYSKVWKDKPFNISISANHNQNTTQRLININLPDIAFNVNTQYPFRRKEAIGDLKWYENIGIALNTNVRSLSSFYDTARNIGRQLIDKFQWGASHSVPLSLSLPQVGAIQVSPTVTYQEKWYQQKFIRSWNTINKKVDTTINKGFFTARDMSFGLGASTRIFGLYTFRKSSKVQAIRHEIRPSVSINYKPDFTGNTYYNTQIDTLSRVARFSVYEGSIYGPFSEGKFGGLNFGIDNNIQMKVRNKKDTSAEAVKKISLLDGLSINGSYNFMADSFKLSTLSLSARSNLFEKINITANASFDPYLTNNYGERIDKLVWSKRVFTLGQLTYGSVSLQSSFRGGDKTKKTNNSNNNMLNNTTQQVLDASGLPLDEAQQEAAYIRNNPGEFADFSIPWDISFAYSLRFNRQRKADYSGFETLFYQDVNWNGSVNLTPRWKIGLTGFYNITTKELGTISMYLSRELHCWQMSINISPVGTYKFFTINISPKSGLLRDLKINRTRYFYDL